jgi:hypothetical protein
MEKGGGKRGGIERYESGCWREGEKGRGERVRRRLSEGRGVLDESGLYVSRRGGKALSQQQI